MIELKKEYPYIDDNGIARLDLEKHYAENELGERFYIKQLPTNIIYAEAVDVYPCRYSYVATEEIIETEPIVEENNVLQETIE